MAEHIPTTDLIREWCADDGGQAEYYDPINGHLQADRVRIMFDAWLKEHDRKVDAAARDQGYSDGYSDGFNAGQEYALESE